MNEKGKVPLGIWFVLVLVIIILLLWGLSKILYLPDCEDLDFSEEELVCHSDSVGRFKNENYVCKNVEYVGDMSLKEICYLK